MGLKLSSLKYQMKLIGKILASATIGGIQIRAPIVPGSNNELPSYIFIWNFLLKKTKVIGKKNLDSLSSLLYKTACVNKISAGENLQPDQLVIRQYVWQHHVRAKQQRGERQMVLFTTAKLATGLSFSRRPFVFLLTFQPQWCRLACSFRNHFYP